ncbi:AraC family transcriptional regulator [Stappia sp. BW2]|uniref:AraC-like ligand-binding domain-containing protein n=1 Tax=Stappia sp. BW2 TaxID=2592622 RepID=UPI0011DEF0BD|nr:AraC family transcriptional regulator [Stappia sp. BW2]TYC64847.1 AraC family transcriptional regulator [Stappia sp. BW2]
MLSQTGSKTPLERFRCFATSDVDEAREIVARHFCNHRLGRFSASDSFDACQNRVSGQHLSLNYLRYGADVAIEPGELSDFYLVQVPISGAADVRNGCRSMVSTPAVASILNPDRHTAMRWHAGCEQILLQIETGFLQEVAARMAGVSVGQVRFEPEFNLLSQEGAAWARRLRGILGAVEEGRAFQGTGILEQRHLEEALVGTLLEFQPNTVSPLLERQETGKSPAILKRAVKLIGERFADDISLLDISTHARTSPRNLQLQFRQEFGCSPLQYLQNVRLSYARHLLLSEGRGLPVAEVAYRSGHRHLGRFSVAYRERFGETPGATGRAQRFG